MVGNFLHSTRTNRPNSTPERTSSTHPSPAPIPAASIGAIASSMNYNPYSVMSSTSRYAAASSSYNGHSVPYMPPQNLTAEAVAALPPPGKFHRCATLRWSVYIVVSCVAQQCFIVTLPTPSSPQKVCQVRRPLNSARRMHPVADRNTWFMYQLPRKRAGG